MTFEDLENEAVIVCTEVKELSHTVKRIWTPFPYPSLASNLQTYWVHYVSFHSETPVSSEIPIELWSSFVIWVWDAARAKKMTNLGYPDGQLTIYEIMTRKFLPEAAKGLVKFVPKKEPEIMQPHDTIKEDSFSSSDDSTFQ
jgi:hypothetical protein